METPTPALGDLLFGQTRGRVLALIYGFPDEPFFVRQIARRTASSAGTVQRELKILAAVGLIERTTNGGQVFYQANRDSPAFTHLRALIATTVGTFHQLRSALLPLAERISFAFVYGSMARGDETSASDADLMIVGSVSLDEVLMSLASVEMSIGRQINPSIYSVDEFHAKLEGENHFLRSVTGGKKVFLIGDEDELGKVGGVRLAPGRTLQRQ